MQLSEAKTRISIPELWVRLGLLGRAKKSCRCPWRQDRHSSFSVYANGTRWKDHGTAESGDVVDFFQQATGLSQGEACRQFIQLAMGCAHVNSVVNRPVLPSGVTCILPTLLPGTHQDRLTLASARSIGGQAGSPATGSQTGNSVGDSRAFTLPCKPDPSASIPSARFSNKFSSP
jgi:hypothetical protein